MDKTVSIYGGVLLVVKFKKEDNLKFLNIEKSKIYGIEFDIEGSKTVS